MEKSFKSLGIMATSKALLGTKVQIETIINKKISVEAFRIVDSKVKKGEDCLHIQFSMDGNRHVVFTGSTSLMDLIQQVNASDFPFTTTIIKEHRRLSFT